MPQIHVFPSKPMFVVMMVVGTCVVDQTQVSNGAELSCQIASMAFCWEHLVLGTLNLSGLFPQLP